jgi:outer membrane protein assembly factor BamC
MSDDLFAIDATVWDRVIGQERAVANLRACAVDPVHAYLFVGPPGSTKDVAARAFAAVLLAGDESANSRTGRLALAGEHPDVREVRRVGASLDKDQITWQARPSDPALEAEMLYRLMTRLGAPEAVVAQARAGDRVAAAGTTGTARASTPARARALTDGRREIDEGFERAWRAVGASLDRGGFTVEDRDRAGGIYFVRYIDRNAKGKGSLFDRMINVFRSDESKSRLARYRIVVKGESASKSSLTVLDANGQPETSDTVKAIRETLLKDLQ